MQVSCQSHAMDVAGCARQRATTRVAKPNGIPTGGFLCCAPRGGSGDFPAFVKIHRGMSSWSRSACLRSFRRATKSSHFHERGAPSGKGADFRYGPLLEVEQRNDVAVFRGKHRQQFFRDFARGESVARRFRRSFADKEFDPFAFALAEIRPAPLRASLFPHATRRGTSSPSPSLASQCSMARPSCPLYWSIRENIFMKISCARSSSASRRARCARTILMTSG